MTEPFSDVPDLTAPLADQPVLSRRFFDRGRVYLFAGVPVVALLFVGGAKWVRLPGSDPRLVTRDFRALETQLDRSLYAPTAFPPGVPLSPADSPTAGARRVMQAYVTPNSEVGLILAQEPRNPDRDAYNRRVFVLNPDRRVDIGEKKGYFITGQTGERRLYWLEQDASIILSSSTLSDEVLVKVAASVRPGPGH